MSGFFRSGQVQQIRTTLESRMESDEMIRQIRPQLRTSTLWLKFRQAGETLALLVLTLACIGIAAQAQTFTVLHSFTGGGDGAAPVAGLTMDRAGNLYGTTSYGGHSGVVYKMFQRNSNWVLSPLYTFK